VHAVDLNQRALAAADVHGNHQDRAVAQALELGDLDRVALAVADHDLAGRVGGEQAGGGRERAERPAVAR